MKYADAFMRNAKTDHINGNIFDTFEYAKDTMNFIIRKWSQISNKNRLFFVAY